MNVTSRRATRVFVIAMTGLFAGHLLLPDDWALTFIVSCAIRLGSAVAILYAVRLWQPPRPLARYLYAAGCFGFFLGEVAKAGVFFGGGTPFAIALGVFPALGGVACNAATVVWMRVRMPSLTRVATLDGAIATLVLVTLSWAFIIQPQTSAGLSQLMGVLSLLAIGSLVAVVAVALRLMSVPENRLASSWYAITSLFLGIFALGGMFILPQPAIADARDPLSLVGGFALTLLAMSALHPSMVETHIRLSRTLRPTAITSRLVLLAFAVSTCPITAIFIQRSADELDVVWAACSVLLMIAVAGRVSIVMRGQARAERSLMARAREQAAIAQLSRKAIDRTKPIDLMILAVELIADVLPSARAAVVERQSDKTLALRAGDELPSDIEQWLRDDVVSNDSADIHEHLVVSPLNGRHHTFGALVAWTHDSTFTEDHENVVRALAAVLTQAIVREDVEIELQQSQRLESIGRLAAGLAHEINTPLQFIGDGVRFVNDAVATLQDVLARHVPEGSLSEDDADDVAFLGQEVPTAITDALDGVARVGNIVSAMKSFSAVEKQGRTWGNLNTTVADVLAVAGHELRNVSTVETALGEIPDAIYDMGEMNQVLLHLLVNAAHAVEDSGRTDGNIVVETVAVGEGIVIKVTDNGCGIRDDIRDKVFDPFFTTKAVGRGAGQGLALVRSIALSYGGSISLEPNSSGTTFRFFLPTKTETARPVPDSALASAV